MLLKCFEEPRYTGSFQETNTAEQIIRVCPWLWAFRQIWAEGWACQSGSIHIPTREMLKQKVGSDSIFFYCVKNHIHTVKKLPPRELLNFADLSKPLSEPNPDSDGETIAERIIASLRISPDVLKEMVVTGKLYIPQIVVETQGPVDRSEHYFMYMSQNESGGPRPNLAPMILLEAGTFEPKWFKKSDITAD